MLNSIDPLFEAFSRSKIEERFALVTFGSKRQILLDGKNITFEGATIDVQLTNNSQAIKNTLTHMWDDVPMISGQTWIDFGLDFAMTELTRDTSRDFAFKTVILLTDGLQFPVTQLHYRAAERLAAKGIIIHTIAFSNSRGFREMQDIAKIGGGKAFFAPDQASLITAFEEVATMSPIAIID